MHESTLAKRYANAMANLASEHHMLEKVGEELNQFFGLLNSAPELKKVLTDPTTAQQDQVQILEGILENSPYAGITRNFLRLLVSKRRMSVLDYIVAAYNRVLEGRSGRLTVTVKSPVLLNEEISGRLQSTLTTITAKDVILEQKTEPDLLGGLVIQIGSLVMDYSIRSKLTRLKAHMKG